MKQDICALEDILPLSGVGALVNGEQVAIFRTDAAETVYAVSNFDPFSGANVLSRGLVGSVDGKLVVASPLYKQHFDLATGECIEDASVTLATWQASVENGRVLLSA